MGWLHVRQSRSKEAHALLLKDLQLMEEITMIRKSHAQMYGCKYCLMFGKRIQSGKKQQSSGRVSTVCEAVFLQEEKLRHAKWLVLTRRKEGPENEKAL